ncbi:hypothetical protein EV421DRAFT_549034 [Armillaria borealis]|uniref:Uncharacterized protein n=1 Tax=Armillaria borealis TaxID=47425 RepID=A0AA39MQ03_9AGAR|nr:hypothetical protein EV421DRAFT_549034 [Armillaria borealis]
MHNMLSVRAPMLMYLLQPWLPPLPEAKIPEYKIPEPRPMRHIRMLEPPLVSCPAPPPPVSAPPPGSSSSATSSASYRRAAHCGTIYDHSVDVLRDAVPSTFPSDAEHRISTPDTTTSTMTGISWITCLRSKTRLRTYEPVARYSRGKLDL